MKRFAPVLFLLAAACGSSSSSDDDASNDAITSNDGAVLEFAFTGELTTEKDTPARQAIVSQLQYIQGTLTTDVEANGQVGLVALSEIRETPNGDTKTIAFTASLPVIWPKGKDAPKAYDLALPADTTKLDAFNAKYDGKCGTNEYGRETFWHDWNPKAAGCAIDEADVHRSKATVRPHPNTTEGKYPEYDQVWADDELDVVAVFGIISSNTDGDEGARERESVIASFQRTLTNAKRVDNTPGASSIKDSTLTGTILVDGKSRKVKLDAILVNELASTGGDFDERFGAATEGADLLVYSGHSGLGKNINAFAQKARAKKGHYQLAYLNGCQTFAYLGTAMHDKRRDLNGAAADPNGTKFLDVVANALPAYGDNGRTIVDLYDAMTGYKQHPKSYNDILTDFSSIHLVAVFGEEDNTFSP
jgi:hypothetical protein